MLDWFFRDRKTGRIVVGQWPNLPLGLFAAASLAAWAAQGSPASVWADLAARLVLAWWALDELLRGVNPWRRCLGAAVLAGLALRLVL